MPRELRRLSSDVALCWKVCLCDAVEGEVGAGAETIVMDVEYPPTNASGVC